MKDVVIGSASNLDWNRCKFWINSLNRSGFEGDKILCLFGDNGDLAENMKEQGVEVIQLRALEPSEHICSLRFYIYFALLSDKQRQYGKVIATDVTDVVFQKNPSEFLSNFDNDRIIASSENLLYKDEPWGMNNINHVFGSGIATQMQDNEINNAGVIVAGHSYFRDLSYMIYAMGEKKNQHVHGGGAPDQAIYNRLLMLEPFKSHTVFIGHDSGWACQVGTTMDPNKPHYLSKQVQPSPKFNGDTVQCSSNIDFYIVHQYNRNPQIANVFWDKYK